MTRPLDVADSQRAGYEVAAPNSAINSRRPIMNKSHTAVVAPVRGIGK